MLDKLLIDIAGEFDILGAEELFVGANRPPK
jgi:hypothetical protein